MKVERPRVSLKCIFSPLRRSDAVHESLGGSKGVRCRFSIDDLPSREDISEYIIKYSRPGFVVEIDAGILPYVYDRFNQFCKTGGYKGFDLLSYYEVRNSHLLGNTTYEA